MKNKVYSSKSAIILCIFGIFVCMFEVILGVCLMIKKLINEKPQMIFMLVIIIFSISWMILYAFIANRFGCKITYDPDKKILYRKGLICGYKTQVKVEDIKEIIIAPFPKETTFYVLIDSVNTKYDGGSKKSFIRIEKTEKNYEFIKQFWDKPIKEYKTYDDLFKKM